MAFNGSGTFSLVSGNPVVTGTTITSTWANNTLSDIASNGLTYCVTKDGQTVPTANLPMGGYYHTAGGTRAMDGSVGTPSLSFSNDTDTGFYSAAANTLGISTGGVGATLKNASTGGTASTGQSFTHLHSSAASVSVNNGVALQCAMGGSYGAIVLLTDATSGNSAVLLITGGGATVEVIKDTAPITGAGKWVVTSSGGTVTATNDWGSARAGNMVLVSGS